jgi:hypothetical protein
MKPDPDLVWYFCDSDSELGLRAQSISGDNNTHSNWPEQRWPSAKMCRAARKKTKIEAALYQLSHRLQWMLKCAYEAQGLTVQERHEHDLCAPLVARALLRMRGASEDDKKQLRALIFNAPRLLEAAHMAFRLAYGPLEPRSRPARRRARVQTWLQEEGLCA